MWRPLLQSINLTEEKIPPRVPIDKKIVENFLGGRGIGVFLAYHAIPTNASARGIENTVIIGTGPLTGSLFPSGGNVTATFKSPHTNTLFTSVCTGKLGGALENRQLNFLQIDGVAKTPVYLEIDEFADISFRDAQPIWKKDVMESDDWLRNRYGNTACILTIGQAAVNQVVFAGAAVDRVNFFRRGGLGAVLASKNLKAIVITEAQQIRENKKVSTDILNELIGELKSHEWYKLLQTHGTFGLIFETIENGALPAKNLSRVLNLDLMKISSFNGFNKEFQCWQCPVRCNRNSYQAFVSLGPNLKILDLPLIQKSISSCENEALDPLSTGAALAALSNIQEDRRKLLELHPEYQWGNVNVYNRIDDIIFKRKLGEQLARGESYLYQLTNEPAPFIKSQIGSMFYYPKILGLALATAISPFGSAHFHSDYMIWPEFLGYPFKLDPLSSHGKVRTVILLENLMAFLDSMIVCSRYLPFFLSIRSFWKIFPKRILNFMFQYLSKPMVSRIGLSVGKLELILNHVLEVPWRWKQILQVGQRITLVERIYNTRMGMSRKEDEFDNFLPKRPDFKRTMNKLLNEYYHLKGINGNGLVKVKTLEQTGLLGLISI
ncbi:MAG: aldehyde ferredoxin oxidoreductase N-terminal domain-containing protein [Candidatus Thorarchaeota archaeon]